MVRYFLLRDNQETGPYTLTELKGKTLYTTDLIWVEDESKCWKQPSEIEALSGLKLATKNTKPIPKKRPRTERINVDTFLTSSASLSPATSAEIQSFLPPEDYAPPSFEALKEKYAQNPPQKKVWKRQVNVGANLMGLVTLFIGLGLSAYMVKKAVDNMEFEPVLATAEASGIGLETLPKSTAAHAAFAGMVAPAEKANLVPDTTFTPVQAPAAGQTGVVLKTTVTEATPKLQKLPVESTVIEEPAKNKTEPDSSETTVATSKPQNTESETNFTKTDEAEKGPAEPSLRLAANQYNVGFLGGISNLQISVTNSSSQEISRAIVEVEFLRPNGKVVGTQTITVSGIAPGSSKTVPVPDHSRGVRVRYKVIKTEG
ncbi:MAG: hypothetical protein EOO10_19685 [Chitinophagaceae bacterium]|nr:MAG: hypothetical protein EOO10_19685 [Chitinophagaceae bacterium]